MEDRRRRERETIVDMLAVTVVMSGFTELEHKTSMSDLNLIVLNVGRVSKEVGEGAPYKKYFCLQSAPFILVFHTKRKEQGRVQRQEIKERLAERQKKETESGVKWG